MSATAEVDVILRAAPHKWGPGKVHIFTVLNRTQCGKTVEECPGDLTAGHIDQVDCLVCVKSYEAEKRRAENQARWESKQEEYRRQRERQDAEWRESYDDYLQSSAWREIRTRVLRRAQGTCEGCLHRPATQVHHLTYERAGNEMCFDLVAICVNCHSRLHGKAF